MIPGKIKGARVFIGLGSNLGDRGANLEGALLLLKKTRKVTLVKVSGFQETAPYGVSGQPLFLNGVAEIRTELSPQALLGVLKDIEIKLGRQERERWGPREIDLDILYYGGLALEEPGLIIPHKDLSNRLFVLKPLAELAPDVIHPVFQLSNSELLRRREVLLNEKNDH